MNPILPASKGRPPGPANKRHSKVTPAAYLKYGIVACVGLYLLTMAGLLRKHWPAGGRAVGVAHAASDDLQAAILHTRATLDVTDVPPEKFITFLVCKVGTEQFPNEAGCA